MKPKKLVRASRFINKKFVIDKSNVKKWIGINCKIWNCSNGACNIKFVCGIKGVEPLNNFLINIIPVFHFY